MHPESPIIEEKFERENLQAEDAISSGNFQEAARILVSIVENDPQNWRAFNNLGVLSWARSFWHDAYAMFLKSVSINPIYVDALLNLFDASLKLRKAQEILPFLENALSIDPNLEEIKTIKESIIEQGNNIYFSPKALSIGVYSQILDEAEKELMSGNLLKAMELFLESNDNEGPNARAFGGLGIICYHQKNFEDSLSLFVESIKLNPLDPEMFLNLLDAAKECNKVDFAREIYNQYRKEFPSLEEIASQFDSVN